MNKLTNKILQKMAGLPYFWIIGDKTLRVNYELNSDSVVFDVGGYEGRWADNIYRKYRCNIHVFEPVIPFAENIRKRFAENDKITVHRFGLSKENRYEKIHLSKDGSSMFRTDGDLSEIKLVKLGDFFSQNKISFVDLVKINIEGGEYDLLDEFIETGLVKKVKNIQIQFHNCIPNAKERMRKIQDLLKQTHKLTYQVEFVWESWTLK